MKSIFKHREAIQLAHDMEHNNTYANALIAENKRLMGEVAEARLDCAVAESNHMNTLERFLEAQERIDELQAENISLRAERDALAKSISIVSQPIETIQPRGIVE